MLHVVFQPDASCLFVCMRLGLLFVFSCSRFCPDDCSHGCHCFPRQKHTFHSDTDHPWLNKRPFPLLSGFWAYVKCSYLPQPAPTTKGGQVSIQQLTRMTNWRNHCPRSVALVTKRIVAVNQHNCLFPLLANPDVHPWPILWLAAGVRKGLTH